MHYTPLHASPYRPPDPSCPFSSSLGDQSRCRGGLVFEGGRDLLGFDVVSGKTVNTGFDENHSANESDVASARRAGETSHGGMIV